MSSDSSPISRARGRHRVALIIFAVAVVALLAFTSVFETTGLALRVLYWILIGSGAYLMITTLTVLIEKSAVVEPAADDTPGDTAQEG